MKNNLFKIKTLGCKVNQYETQLMREALSFAGYSEAEDGQTAEVYIVNTCTVTQKADKESREALRQFIRENPDAEVIAAGCYTEADSTAIKAIDERIRVINNEGKNNIVGIVEGRDCFAALAMTSGISYFKGHNKAFIKVQDGCNNFCSYCKVPYVRGRSRSRPPDETLEEARQLIKNGYKELVLTGVCLGDFGKDLSEGKTLAWLVRKISDIEGDFRIRLSSIELPDVNDDLISEMANSQKLCRHLHIPLQSGDDTVLKKMNRRYSASGFVRRIGYIRMKIPEVAITTDIIVGFPFETDKNFKNTLKAFKKIRPSRTHIFTYSPRKGTRAFDMGDNVPSEIKKQRFKELKKLADKFADEFKQKAKGKDQRVLVEAARDKNAGLLTGYTDTYIRVSIDGPDELIGKLIPHRI